MGVGTRCILCVTRIHSFVFGQCIASDEMHMTRVLLYNVDLPAASQRPEWGTGCLQVAYCTRLLGRRRQHRQTCRRLAAA